MRWTSLPSWLGSESIQSVEHLAQMMELSIAPTKDLHNFDLYSGASKVICSSFRWDPSKNFAFCCCLRPAWASIVGASVQLAWASLVVWMRFCEAAL